MTPLLQAALICLMALLPQAAFAQRAPLSGFGVVLMHGEGGQPGSNTVALAEAL